MMYSFLAYLLKSSVCMLIMWLIYIALMRKTTFFRLNRIYLLAVLIISLIIPLIKVQTDNAPPVQINSRIETLSRNIIYVEQMQENPVDISQEKINQIYSTRAVNAPIANDATQFDYTKMIYFAISALIFINFVIALIKIYKIKRKSYLLNISDTKVAVNNKSNSAFSFIKTFYCNSKTIETTDFQGILQHEKEHIRHLHSLDLIFISILKSIFWLNPMIYIIEKYLKENHEFTADKSVINFGVQKRDYKEILLRANYTDLFSAPVNSFSMSIIKKRFKMLDTKQTSRKSLLKYIGIIPVIAIIFFAFSCEKKVNTTNDKTAFYESMMHPKNTMIQAYDMNGREIPNDSARQFYFHDSKVWGINNISEAAKRAEINNYEVDMGVLIDTSGKVVMAKVNRSRAYEGQWTNDLGYGINEAAINYVKNLPNLQWSRSYNLKKHNLVTLVPGYVYKSVRLIIGDKDIWKNMEHSEYSIAIIFGSDNEYNDQFLHDFRSSGMDRFIKSNLEYPESQIKSNIKGKVFVSFGIGENQKMEDIKISKGINKDFDEEALRVVREYAKTNPRFAETNPDRPILTQEDRERINKKNNEFLSKQDYKNMGADLSDKQVDKINNNIKKNTKPLTDKDKYRFVVRVPVYFEHKK